MFENEPASTSATKLKERNLIHKRIADTAELRRIYEFGEILGKGSFGTVVKANHRFSGVDWAIKIINKLQAGASRVMLVEREIHILKLVNHPNIILLDRVFESPKTIYLVFELCTGSLAKIFKIKKRFEERETLTVIRSLAGALSYLHKNDIVHRDLKLENILIAVNPANSNEDFHIKVTDFGLSAVRGGIGHESMLHDCCGTLTYMAPEMIATKSYSQQCDVWSMGVIMYLLIVGKFPFYSSNDYELHSIVRTHELNYSGLPCSPEAQHLLSKMLQKNPAFRMTAAEVENHPWISGNQSIYQAESSNVLDMMRMWKGEMNMESSMGTFKTVNETTKIVRSSAEIVSSFNDNKKSVLPEILNSKSDASSVEKLANELPRYDKRGFWENAVKPTTTRNDSNSVKVLENAEKSSVRKNFQTISVPGSSVNADSTTNDSIVNENGATTISRESTKQITIKNPPPGTIEKKKRIKKNAEFRQISSRLPDFSHIPAKVDSNLPNLRKEIKSERKLTNMRNRSLQTTSSSAPTRSSAPEK